MWHCLEPSHYQQESCNGSVSQVQPEFSQCPFWNLVMDLWACYLQAAVWRCQVWQGGLNLYKQQWLTKEGGKAFAENHKSPIITAVHCLDVKSFITALRSYCGWNLCLRFVFVVLIILNQQSFLDFTQDCTCVSFTEWILVDIWFIAEMWRGSGTNHYVGHCHSGNTCLVCIYT